MSKQEVTPWFDGDVKPAHCGKYDRYYSVGNNIFRDFWDGSLWRYVDGGQECIKQARPWRGLAKKPGAKP